MYVQYKIVPKIWKEILCRRRLLDLLGREANGTSGYAVNQEKRKENQNAHGRDRLGSTGLSAYSKRARGFILTTTTSNDSEFQTVWQTGDPRCSLNV
jgi:hypothetical protein